MTIELAPLCVGELELAEPLDLGQTPSGRRMVWEIVSARFTGERFSASLVGAAAADWFTLSPDGTIGTPDVRLTVKTDDGALVWIRYSGRLEVPHLAAGASFFMAPLFETGDDRYRWLAGTQAVARGFLSPDRTRIWYEYFELRSSGPQFASAGLTERWAQLFGVTAQAMT